MAQNYSYVASTTNNAAASQLHSIDQLHAKPGGELIIAVLPSLPLATVLYLDERTALCSIRAA